MKINFRHITAKNIDRLMDEIENVDWKEITLSKEPNEAYNIFNDKLINIYNKTVHNFSIVLNYISVLITLLNFVIL